MKEVNELRLQIASKKTLSAIDHQGKTINTNWKNRQNLHIFNLWPVIYHAEKNSCANHTPETLSV